MEKRYKYPRTFHLPWTLSAANDDKILSSLEHFEGQEVVVSIKMDGENTTIYRDGMHARSIGAVSHPSQAWVRNFAAQIGHEIPQDFRVCGENLYALHSLAYESLESYFYGFSVWNGDVCLSWDETLEWFELFGITSVPVLYRGTWNEAVLRDLAEKFDTEKNEGYVVRLADSFKFEDFRMSVAKWVRAGHVQTDEHWSHKAVVPNKLRGAA
jgi:ATP-dependent RNA circularization protein (DNA/RNA ligase family)